MRKTMICVYAPSNKGKTRTIKKVHELLGGKKEVRNNSNDFVDIIMFGEVKIGFESAGDPDSEQEEAIEYLMKKNVILLSVQLVLVARLSRPWKNWNIIANIKSFGLLQRMFTCL